MNKTDKIQSYSESIKVHGSRIGVLLIHGLGGAPMELRFLAQALTRQGYTVHCPHLVGLGSGTDVSNMSTWQDWYAAALSAHDELRAECDVVFVGGLSAGSMLALKLAHDRPETVHGLMLFAPTLWPNGWSIPLYFHLFRLVHQRWFANLFHFHLRAPYGIKDERIRSYVLNSLSNDERSIDEVIGRRGVTILEFRRMVRNVRKLFGKIRQQTLIFHPRADDQSDLDNTIALQRKLGGLVETCVLEDCYHLVTLDRQRGFVIDRTVEFVSRMTRRIRDEASVAQMTSRIAE